MPQFLGREVTIRNLVKNLNFSLKIEGIQVYQQGGIGDPRAFLCGRPIAVKKGDLLGLIVLVLSKRV